MSALKNVVPRLFNSLSFWFRFLWPNLKGQSKTGHAWSLQNRPYGMARDVILIYPAFC